MVKQAKEPSINFRLKFSSNSAVFVPFLGLYDHKKGDEVSL